jgi:hypothetical protein
MKSKSISNFEKKMEIRLKKLKMLDDKYDGKVTSLLYGLGKVIREYNAYCKDIYSKIEKYKKKRNKKGIGLMDEKLRKLEEKQHRKIDLLLASLPPALRKEMMK